MIGPLAFAGMDGLLPEASSMAPRIDATFFSLVALSAAVVALLGGLNLTFLVRYRRGAAASRTPVRIATWKIETAWIVATTLVFVVIFVVGARAYLDQERPPAEAYVISVVARQWMWDIRQPNGRREFNSLHVPIGRPVRLEMTSEDVIHSLFIPAFRIKQDVVPGRTVDTWLEATRPGTYHLFCTQYCGTEHARMVGEVIVQTPEDYAAWLAAGSGMQSATDRGRQLFLRYGCSGCHAPASVVSAPPLGGIYGKTIPLDNGQFVTVDGAYLRDSILEPGKQVAAGYKPVMPSFKGIISESDLLDLVAYLKSLADPALTSTPVPTPP